MLRRSCRRGSACGRMSKASHTLRAASTRPLPKVLEEPSYGRRIRRAICIMNSRAIALIAHERNVRRPRHLFIVWIAPTNLPRDAASLGSARSSHARAAQWLRSSSSSRRDSGARPYRRGEAAGARIYARVVRAGQISVVSSD